jgi:two-component system OmpR family response regulator
MNRCQVLVVEDDTETREALAAVLDRAGYAVVTACDGLDALTHLTCARRPDVIILDLHMPELDGWALVRELRAVRAGIPIIVTTARHDAGGLDLPCLEKPYRMQTLLALVAQHVCQIEDGRF